MIKKSRKRDSSK